MTNFLAGHIRAARHRLTRTQPSVSTGIGFETVIPFLPSDPVIIEAGASTGMDLEALLQLWPEATIHAFEPEPGAFSELQERAMSMPGVYPWNLALGSENGEIELHVSHGEYGTMSSSLLAPQLQLEAHPKISFDTATVPQETLSDWASRCGVHRVDFLALDMQGFEYAALDAGRAVLRSARVVMSETFLVEMYAGAVTVERLQALLTGEGFVILKTHIHYARTFELLAVRRDALEEAIFSGRLPTHGSAGSLG